MTREMARTPTDIQRVTPLRKTDGRPVTCSLGDRQVLPPCQRQHDAGFHQFIAFEDRRAVVQRREFLKYRFQQLRGYGRANGHASLQQFVDRILPCNYQQSAKMQSSESEGASAMATLV